MTSVPSDIRIEDLSAPRLDADVSNMMGVAVEMAGPVYFDEGRILERAAEETGLDDFGDGAFREPLSVLLGALENADLSAFGRVSMSTLIVQLAKNRLRIRDLLRRNPQILDIEIKAPIVIAGLQRSGTTHLHNLLSSDPLLRSLPYWESLEPVAASSEAAGEIDCDPRVERCSLALAFQDQAMPLFKRMHEMTTWHAHEEIQLLAINFSTMLFEALIPLPEYRDYYKSEDQTPHYRYLKTVLQVLTWLRGGDRWVLKSPQHFEQFGPLVEVFPDATFVLTHRDPISVIASTATMNCYAARFHRDFIDVPSLGRYWADRTEDMLRSCVADRSILPEQRTIDIPFHEYMAGDMAAVERIYDVANQPLSDSARRAMMNYLAEHPRGRHGRIAYKLSDFALDADELRTRLQFYVDRFALQWETTAL